MWLQHHRPPWLRARTVRMKRMIGRLPAPTACDDARALVSGSRRIDELIDCSRLADNGQLERALTLEVVIRHWSIG